MKVFSFVFLVIISAGHGSLAQATKTFKLMDNQGFGEPMVAMTISVPESWIVSGQVLWLKPCSSRDSYEIVFSARSPDGRTGFRLKPGHQILWLETGSSGFLDPFTQQLLAAQTEAQLNEMRTKFANSNCHVGRVSGTEQLLEMLVLRDRPADTKITSQVPDTKLAEGYKQLFGASNIPGMNIVYDARFIEMSYTLNGQPVEESMSFSWYMFELLPDPTLGGTYSQHTVVEPFQIAWFAPERKQQDQAQLAALIQSIRIDPAWQEKVNEFHRKLSKQSADDAERRRREAEKRRDKQHEQFLEIIRQ